MLSTSLIILTLNSQSDLRETDRNIREFLNRDIKNVTNSLTQWIDDRTLVISNLAKLAETLGPGQMQSYLEFVRLSDSNLGRIN